MQGPLHPGTLPRLLGELCLAGRSGRLRLEWREERLDVGLHDGRIVGLRRLERPEALFEAFAWDDGSYSFEEGPATSPGEQAPAAGVPLSELIREGLRRVADPAVVRLALGDLDSVLVPAADEGRAVAASAAEDFVLSEVDGVRSIREVIRLVPLPAAETQRCILGLLCMDALRSQPPASEGPAAAAAPQPPPERRSPQVPPSPPEPEAPGEPRRVRERPETRDAFDALGIRWHAAAEDPVENALQVAQIIRRASTLTAESDHWGAIQLLVAVIPRIQARRQRHEAQVLLARAHAKNPKWLRRGEAILQGVIREDSSCAEAYFVLGAIYKELGLRSRAMGMFRKVLALEPRHTLAAEALRSFDPRPPQRGLFGT